MDSLLDLIVDFMPWRLIGWDVPLTLTHDRCIGGGENRWGTRVRWHSMYSEKARRWVTL